MLTNVTHTHVYMHKVYHIINSIIMGTIIINITIIILVSGF